MPATAEASTVPTGVLAVTESTPPRPWVLIKRLLVIAALAVVVVEALLDRDSLASAVTAVDQASWTTIALAVAASIASMWCFGAVRQVTMRAAGVNAGVGQAVSMSYAAGALHTTLPGGSVFATAYAFRRLRAWGASTSTATWCLAVTGVLAAGTLALVAVGAFALGGGLSASSTRLALELGSLGLVLVLLVGVTRRPESLLSPISRVLHLVNRVLARPADAGVDAAVTLLSDLGAIRPTPRSWAAATGLSLGNWAFDAACLSLCCTAVGLDVPLQVVLVTYVASMAAVSASPLPAGIGVVEGVLAVGLTAGGATASAAVAAVLIYRLVSTGGTAAIGWTVLAVERWRSNRVGVITAAAPVPS